MKYKLNKDGTCQIINGKTYTENGITYTISSTATTVQLEEIDIFEVQKKPLQDGFQYSNDTELIDGVVYYKQVEIVEMPKIFDVSKFKDDVKEIFGQRKIVLLPYWGAINDNLKFPMLDKHYKELKEIMDGLLLLGKVTQDDCDKFKQCFALQGVNLNNY